MATSPKSAISENLMRKIANACHIEYGNSLVIASFYNIGTDLFEVGIFGIDGILHKFIHNENMIGAVESLKDSEVMHAVADILTAGGQQLVIDPISQKEIIFKGVQRQNF